MEQKTSNVKVCVRFRPLNSREKKISGDEICFRQLDAESFVFKDEKGEDTAFSFDRVFYMDSEQEDVFEFLAKPVVQDSVNAINGTIMTYGQTGAGKTYSLEGPSILECDSHNKGLLPRVVDGLFESLKSSVHTIKLSVVEIYMERLRDLLDVSKDNLQIREGKAQGIYIAEATEVSVADPADALACISRGIANKAVGSTHMNMASSRSHCLYTFLVQQEDEDGRVKCGKLMLVDLAGSEKVEKTGAEGKVLEEAKTINKSLSALGNVINALTSGKKVHIPYRSSKLTRILEDALGGNSRTALLCCCSPSSSNALESLSTLRFGTRAKLIKPPRLDEVQELFPEKASGEVSPDDESSWTDTTSTPILKTNSSTQMAVQQIPSNCVSLLQMIKEITNELKLMNESLNAIHRNWENILKDQRTAYKLRQINNALASLVCIFSILYTVALNMLR